MTAALAVAGDVDALRDLIAAAVNHLDLGEDVPPDAVDGVTVRVFDGPSTATDRPYAARSVTVAAAFEDDQDAVSVTRTTSGYGRRVTEEATVACSVYAGSGNTEGVGVDRLRADAAAVLQAIDDALAADPLLGGRVARCGIDGARWVQGADPNGVGVYIGFTVTLLRLP
jgi:hypothetical protein